MRGIDVLLADDGVLVAENHDLASVVDGGQWDTVYHEHLRFSTRTASIACSRLTVRGTDGKKIPTHGGSFRMFAKARTRRRCPPPVPTTSKARTARGTRPARPPRGSHNVVGIGATARATTIINYCGLDVEDIAYVCEVPGSDKIGHYIPGTRIPVVDEARLFEDQQDAVLFSWHMADVIVPKLRERGYTGEIIIPLPTPAYV